ncbi:hypothetical protein V8E53_000440 [Lactarius tabidus]
MSTWTLNLLLGLVRQSEHVHALTFSPSGPTPGDPFYLRLMWSGRSRRAVPHSSGSVSTIAGVGDDFHSTQLGDGDFEERMADDVSSYYDDKRNVQPGAGKCQLLHRVQLIQIVEVTPRPPAGISEKNDFVASRTENADATRHSPQWRLIISSTGRYSAESRITRRFGRSVPDHLSELRNVEAHHIHHMARISIGAPTALPDPSSS